MGTLWESIRSAFEMLNSSRLRSALTMLGVIIGVFAVVMLVALGEGAKKYVVMQVQGMGLGAHTIIIHPGKKGIGGQNPSLTYGDCQALKEEIPEVVDLSPGLIGATEVKYGPRKRTINVIVVDAVYPDITNRHVIMGRFYTPFEVRSRRKVVVLGTKVVKELFHNAYPIGERMLVGGEKFTVVGVLQEKGRIMEFDMDDLGCVPYTTAESVFGTDNIAEIIVLTKGGHVVPRVNDHIYEILKQRHGGRLDFHTHTQEEMLSQLDIIMDKLTLAVTAIAGISLLVGGVGIMNIMLVAVTERTREIGIRKSVGATNSHIFQQFLVEAIIISVLGGSLGLLISIAGCYLLGWAIHFEFVTPGWSIIIGLTFSAFVGMVSGVYPAMRAAHLDPIQALRYD